VSIKQRRKKKGDAPDAARFGSKPLPFFSSRLRGGIDRSIFCWKFAPLSPREVTVLETIRLRILHLLLAEIRKIVGEAHVFTVKLWINFSYCPQCSDPPLPSIQACSLIQSQDLHEGFTCSVECYKLAIISHAQAICKCGSAWVRNPEQIVLGFIASAANVQEIRVVSFFERVNRNGNQVVDVKRRTSSIPSLTMKAIHAPKQELVPQPLAVAFVRLIATRAVTPNVRSRGILETLHHVPFLLAFVVPRTRDSSSSRT